MPLYTRCAPYYSLVADDRSATMRFGVESWPRFLFTYKIYCCSTLLIYAARTTAALEAQPTARLTGMTTATTVCLLMWGSVMWGR